MAHFEAMGFWAETIDRWHNEGLPKDRSPWEYFRIDQFMDNAPESLRYHTDSVTTLPYLKEFVRYMKERHKFQLFMLDSDGNDFPLLPFFQEAGINIFIPCEIMAGMEPVAIREKYPNLSLLGGIGKGALIRGEKKGIEEEIMRKVPVLLEQGGYFPSLDHHVPPDVSFESFSYYLEFLRKL